ncbi:YybH family protein [Marinobacter sp. M1N3S26]|uniref:YybH family protein n=1 Tax=Marinobacter sp. M1N3S26 TaxID=3382299 RepID=UPI00387B5B3A
MNIETTIKTLSQRWMEAAANNDLDAVMALYHTDIRSFDAILALQVEGAAAYREHWGKCMESCPGDPFFEMYDLKVEASNSLAVAHSLTYCGATLDGEKQGGWMRGTQVWRRDGEQWRIVHEHFSCPFNPEDMSLIMEWQPSHDPVRVN